MEFNQFGNDHQKEFFVEIVQKALEGKHSDFEFIKHYGMWKATRLYKSSTKKVVKLFSGLIKGLINQYQNQILDGTQSLEVIMAIKQFEVCRDYYKKEHMLAKDMLSEFGCYIRSGHILQTLLGGIRPDFECVDYRKLPIKFF